MEKRIVEQTNLRVLSNIHMHVVLSQETNQCIIVSLM